MLQHVGEFDEFALCIEASFTRSFGIEPVLRVLVFPVRSDAPLCNRFHVLRADLELNAAIAGAEEGGVKRAIAVRLWNGDVILELLRQRRPLLVRRAERLITFLCRVHDQAVGKDVAEILERDRLVLELPPDRIRPLHPALQVATHAASKHDGVEIGTDAVEHRRIIRHQLFEALHDGRISDGIHLPERQVFQFTGKDRETHAARQRRIDIQRFARHAQARFLGRHELDRPHVVQAVGQLHEQDADILRGGEYEFLKVLGLLLRTRNRLAFLGLRQFGDAVDKFSHFLAEHLADFADRNAAVLDHIVEQPRDDRGLIHPDFG